MISLKSAQIEREAGVEHSLTASREPWSPTLPSSYSTPPHLYRGEDKLWEEQLENSYEREEPPNLLMAYLEPYE